MILALIFAAFALPLTPEELDKEADTINRKAKDDKPVERLCEVTPNGGFLCKLANFNIA
jgi:hypothetical protein